MVARRTLLCLALALAPLLWAQAARAAPTGQDQCTATAAAPPDMLATVSDITSIAPDRVSVAITLDCGGVAASFATCSSYAAANPLGDAPWTAIRDNETSTGADNHILLRPRTGSSDEGVATAPDTLYGNRPGTGGVLTIVFDIAAVSGAVIESGRYRATIVASPVLIDTGGGVAPDAACSAYGTTGTEIALGSVPILIAVDVPQTCTTGIPAQFDFGEVLDLADDLDATVTMVTRCNSNSLKFNVYIDGGTGTDNGALTMKSAAGGEIRYGLFSDPQRETAFPRTGLGSDAANQGPYSQTTDPAGTPVALYGRVPAQPRPAPGAYQDQVTVHVEY